MASADSCLITNGVSTVCVYVFGRFGCDRYGHELAGESPVIISERREYVDKGKGARRNSLDLLEEGASGVGEPMGDLKEAGVKPATQAWYKPLEGFADRVRYPELPKPDTRPRSSGMGGRDQWNTHLVDEMGYVAPLIATQLFSDNVKDRSTIILDVGCGTGLVGENLHRHGYKDIEGLDYSRAMLEKAGQK